MHLARTHVGVQHPVPEVVTIMRVWVLASVVVVGGGNIPALCVCTSCLSGMVRSMAHIPIGDAGAGHMAAALSSNTALTSLKCVDLAV